MSLRFNRVAVLSLLSLVAALDVTPVEKVITLLEGMKSDIESEAKAEATTYGKFACFCKDTTTTKAKSITDGQDKIDGLSADIAEDTATKQADETKVLDLKDQSEKLNGDLAESIATFTKEKAEYDSIAADLAKALSSLKSALKSMSDKKAAMGAVKFLQVNSGIRESLDLADAMGLIAAPKQQTIKAFLQQGAAVDPADSGYKYKSSDITDLLTSLQTDFKKTKATLDSEFGKTDASFKALKASLEGKLKTNKDEQASKATKIDILAKSVGEDRGDLVEAQDLMKDDELYLKDLTTQCETRANQWDQRSTMRAGEITAISAALKVLGERVKDADADVNARALIQQPEKKIAATTDPVAKTVKVVEAKVAVVAPTKPVESKKVIVSFLQRADINMHSSQAEQEQLMKDSALVAIRDAGLRLKSPVLMMLAMKAVADPFKKVKELIQGLVERLITEAAGEATKKGFCDTELGKANRQKDFRWTNVKKLTAQVEALLAKRDSLTEEIASLEKQLKALGEAAKESASQRADSKKDNAKTLNTARKGLDAVQEALLILRSFYKEAAKGAALLQASPVDEDTTGPGFSGGYQGKQGSSNAVLDLLETIASDFQRTVRTTESDEKSAAENYVKFDRATKADIAGKTTKRDLDAQDLKTTLLDLDADKTDLQNNMDLVDDAVKTLMDLKPTCVDTGMSYKERVQKREDEVAALKKALCLLDPEKVEPDCK